MHDPAKGYPALRRGRTSVTDANYFLTICAQRPCELLATANIRDTVLAEIQRIESTGGWRLRCATFMPDHLHLLVQLGAALDLATCVRLLKGRISPLLRDHRSAWQPGFYDHRLRESDDVLAVFLYIFLNPYRGNLLPANQRWSGFFCCQEDWDWFGPLTAESRPEPAWLR